MSVNGEMNTEDYIQIKKMYMMLSLDDVRDDITILVELIKKHHPNGAPIFEKIVPDYSEKDNPKYHYTLSTAIIEFRRFLSLKYKDSKMQSAVFLKVITEINK